MTTDKQMLIFPPFELQYKRFLSLFSLGTSPHEKQCP